MWLGPVTTLIAAVTGTWLGARLALRQYKGQRAFDLRAQWYADMFGALTELGWLYFALQHADSAGDPLSMRTRSERIRTLTEDRIGILAGSAELYASQEGVHAIRNLNVKVMIAEHEIARLPIFGRTREEWQANVEAIGTAIQEARRALAKEFRNDMKWEEISITPTE